MKPTLENLKKAVKAKGGTFECGSGIIVNGHKQYYATAPDGFYWKNIEIQSLPVDWFPKLGRGTIVEEWNKQSFDTMVEDISGGLIPIPQELLYLYAND